jgi:hypothetical protein
MLAFSFGAVRGTVEFWRCRRRAGDMDNYSVSLSAGPSMQVLTTAPLVYPDGFIIGRAVCTLRN